MNSLSNWIFGFMIAIIWLSSVQCGSIDESVRIDDFTKIGQNVTIKANSMVGSFTNIGSHSTIEENTMIKQHVEIGERCSIGKNVVVNDFAKIGTETSIADQSSVGQFVEIGGWASIAANVMIDQFARIGKMTTIDARARVDQYARIGKNNDIGMDCILAQYSGTATDVKIHEKAVMDQYAKFNGERIEQRGYVGQYCTIVSKTIGEWAVVHEHVTLNADTEVKRTEIYERTPTSYMLYQQCDTDVSSDEINIAKPSGQAISPEFNKHMRERIAASMEMIRKNCLQSSDFNRPPPNLSKIISLYLIQYHGYDKFKKYAKKVQGSSYLPPALRNTLDNELHFKTSSKNVLESDVAEKIIQLLTIDLDANRRLRVDGDKFCAMFNQITSKQRSIFLIDSSPSSSSSSNRNVVHSMISLMFVLVSLKILH